MAVTAVIFISSFQDKIGVSSGQTLLGWLDVCNVD